MNKLLLKRSLSFFFKLKSYTSNCGGLKSLIPRQIRALVRNVTNQAFLTFILFTLFGTTTAFALHALPSVEPFQHLRSEPSAGVSEKMVGETKKQTRRRGDAGTRRMKMPTKISFTPSAEILNRTTKITKDKNSYSPFPIPHSQTTNDKRQTTNNKQQTPNNKLAQQLYQTGSFLEAARVWEETAATFAERGDIANQALVLSHLCLAYQQLGEWEEAETAINQSLSLLKDNQKLTTNYQFILAQVLNNQGNFQLTQALAEEALKTWQAAEAAYEEAGDQLGILGTQLNQAKALQALGMYRRAQTILERVEQALANQPNSPLKAAGLLNLGNTLRLVGDLANAQQVLEQSLAVARVSQSPPDIQAALLSLGNIARAQQNPTAALEFYQQAAAVCNQEEQVQPYPGTAQAVCLSKLQAQLNQLSLLVEAEQWSVAQELLPQIQTQLANLPPNRMAVYGRINFAESVMKLPAGGERQKGWGAEERRSRGAEERRSGGAEEEERTDNFWIQRSRNPTQNFVHPPAGLFSSAQILATAVQQAGILQDPRAQSYAIGSLGGLYQQNQQWSQGENLTRRALMLAQGINAQDIIYQWQWQLGRILCRNTETCNAPTANLPDAIIAYTQAVKTLTSLRSDLVAINSEAQFSFRESVEPIYRELVALLLQPDATTEQQGSNSPSPVPSQDNLKQAREVIESLQLAQLENFFRVACLEAKPQLIDEIDPTAAVIYPIILPERLAVILSLPGQPLRYYSTFLPEAEVENTIKKMRQSLRQTSLKQERLPLAQQIYDWLVKPAQEQLISSNIQTLVFVLDGSLRNLPMAALYDGEQYLVEKYSIALTSGLQLLEARSLQPEEFKALLAGLSEPNQPDFLPLPGVKSELEQIRAKVPSQLLLNQEFTSDSLQAEIAGTSFPVVHLATHGQFSSNLEETFILAWNGKIKIEDLRDLLRSRESEISEPIELLILSACQTASGDQRAALGLAGIAVRSGARSTLATLWSVQDESTARLMVQFYQEFLQGNISKAEALRHAQLALLKQPQYQHPFFWAPFV
ncbi:MAG: CHAT domain-containing protein, partial [Symploca sp. SIO3E6]|nr:CHAT domain-containing protein [Caldora sp. SIO3E6]